MVVNNYHINVLCCKHYTQKKTTKVNVKRYFFKPNHFLFHATMNDIFIVFMNFLGRSQKITFMLTF